MAKSNLQADLSRPYAVDNTQPEVTNDFYKSNGSDTAYFDDTPSLTRQEFADECDINVLMARYEKTGALPEAKGSPVYMDFTEMPDTLMGTLSMLDAAQAEFMRLPAHIRKEFDNDPVMFVDFASDPNNIDQLREWGLAKPKEAPDAEREPPPPPPPPELKAPPAGS
ncbi:internal scaffolding protein [Blackfly microvirus SF02]|uniref:Internal scaffolding protein n=1 Tax=Blackfly microvirus SF02 TaxID=2576452 RepID=A0A4P8PJV0_9VIRU|nr:internal scaffolding protein [Blackfly microvirus SF02]